VNLYIPPVNALIFAIACAVTCLVYRRAKNQQSTAGATANGNPAVEALAAGGVALAMLAFLFGVGDGSFTSTETPSPKPPAISSSPSPR
jgi:multisubunit Na+/H+ antiporter MnhB subunit